MLFPALPVLLSALTTFLRSHHYPVIVGNLQLKSKVIFHKQEQSLLGLPALHPDRGLATASSQQALPGDGARASKNNSVSKNSACSITSGAGPQLVRISVEGDGFLLYYGEATRPLPRSKQSLH